MILLSSWPLQALACGTMCTEHAVVGRAETFRNQPMMSHACMSYEREPTYVDITTYARPFSISSVPIRRPIEFLLCPSEGSK